MKFLLKICNPASIFAICCLFSANCANNPTVEIRTAAGDEVILRGDAGLAATGDLGDSGGGLLSSFQNRNTMVTQSSTLEQGAGIIVGDIQVTGLTLNRTAPTATVMRGATGIARQAKQTFFIGRFFDWLKADSLAGHATDQLEIETDGQVASETISAGVQSEIIAADVRKVEIAEFGQ